MSKDKKGWGHGCKRGVWVYIWEDTCNECGKKRSELVQADEMAVGKGDTRPTKDNRKRKGRRPKAKKGD